MKQHSDDMSTILQNALFARKAREQERQYRRNMPRLIDDQRRNFFLKCAALVTVAATLGFGIKPIMRGMEQARYNHYIRNVPASQRAEADRYYNMTNHVKLVDYELGDAKRVSGRGIFSNYESDLYEYYDTDRDGRIDLRITTQVDPEIFLCHEEADYADRKHGSWDFYSERMKDVARDTSAAHGRI